MRIKKIWAGFALMAVLAPSPAFALLCGIPLDPMTVTATPLYFGTYTGGSASVASATIQINCAIPLDLLPNFTVALSGGNSGLPLGRYMQTSSTSQRLNYNIYPSLSFITPWGDGTNGTALLSYNGVLLHLGNTSFTVYGQLPAGQFVPPGTYSDTIMVTVSY